jgi:hypothetical protein
MCFFIKAWILSEKALGLCLQKKAISAHINMVNSTLVKVIIRQALIVSDASSGNSKMRLWRTFRRGLLFVSF